MRKTRLTLVLLVPLILLTACFGGDDGSNGLNSLFKQTPLKFGNYDCWGAGTRFESGLDKNKNGQLDDNEIEQVSVQCGRNLFIDGVALPYKTLVGFQPNGTTIDSPFSLRQGG